MAWRCPACQLAIQHGAHEDHPRPGARYRCHSCRLELTLDPKSVTVAVLRSDANEILWNDSFAELLIERCLKIGLLAERKQTRSRQQFLRAEGCKVSRESLKHVTVRTLFGCRMGCRGLKQRRTGNDTSVADEAGMPGDCVRRSRLSCDKPNHRLGRL